MVRPSVSRKNVARQGGKMFYYAWNMAVFLCLKFHMAIVQSKNFKLHERSRAEKAVPSCVFMFTLSLCFL